MRIRFLVSIASHTWSFAPGDEGIFPDDQALSFISSKTAEAVEAVELPEVDPPVDPPVEPIVDHVVETATDPAGTPAAPDGPTETATSERTAPPADQPVPDKKKGK